ncbi:hypothetical protein PGC34_12190 [Pseudomonas kribbensis]|jgi:hypothetical protein|uniref:Uncharacterized protein n=1 Tax=Pseudomonas kribbensis TaxID=1628086 RepID=A0A4Y8VIH9_9PSED|nr:MULTISPECIES: hypothetical protein [Pseudomonas]MDL5601542.1 hypothetical protein [Bacillus subtilis]TFH80257.1 hypothetical protein E4J90_12370 [Pseudomonas kribbensis]
MSYEYKVVFDDTTSASKVMKEIEDSDACVRAQQPGDLYLKDQSLNSSADYDARVIYESESVLWLQVNFKSLSLYQTMLSALGDSDYRCLEDGDDDEEVPLKEAFRIKGNA